MATVRDDLQAAFTHHQAGRLREAEALYRQVLVADPAQADAWHLLGLVAHQVGQHAAARQAIGRAITLRGNRALFHANLGAVLEAMGQLDEAERSLLRALELEPQAADPYNNLGNVYARLGKSAAAEAAYRRAIELRADFAAAHNNLGTLLHRRGELDAAIASYRQALAAQPQYVDACNNLGTALQSKGLLSEAAELFRQAVAIAPQSAAAHLNLGAVQQAQGELAEAIRSYREAVRLDASLAIAHNNLGAALREQGNQSEAEDSLRRALALDSRLADAYFNLGLVHEDRHDAAAARERFQQALNCDDRYARAWMGLARSLDREERYEESLPLWDRAVAADLDSAHARFCRANARKALGQLQEAVADYREALRLDPRLTQAHGNLAVMYNDLGLPDAAADHCRQGLALEPNSAALHANLATALVRQGRQVEAIAAARRAVELNPQGSGEHSNLLYLLNFADDQDPQAVFQEHLDWASRHAEPLTRASLPNNNDRTPDRRLRIGYVSPYFREHAVNFFVEPILASHDHERFEIYCYSDARISDAATDRLRESADHWRATRGLSDEQLAQRIREDRIDILVDLTGHIAGSRLPAFARRPAPVQVTYIGYQHTTGMSAMDYRLTDQRADPPGATDRYYTERLVRLPRSFFCYRPAAEAPEVTPLPARTNGYVTFGSFNNFMKVTPRVIDTWVEILDRVPNSRLLLLASRGGYAERQILDAAKARGIDPARIEISGALQRDAYYRLVQRADIALDPFPFNGHTTTCDSLWLGVPVVMLLGQTYASRFGSTALASVGVDEWIADSKQSYVETAVRWAGQLDALAAMRGELRERMARSPLLDFAGFTRALEAAYRQMWIEWCSGQSEPRLKETR